MRSRSADTQDICIELCELNEVFMVAVAIKHNGDDSAELRKMKFILRLSAVMIMKLMIKRKECIAIFVVRMEIRAVMRSQRSRIVFYSSKIKPIFRNSLGARDHHCLISTLL